MDDLDLRQLDDIPDPFAGTAKPSLREAPARTALSPTRGRVRGVRALAVLAALLGEGTCLRFVEHRSDLTSAAPSALLMGLAVPLVAATVAFLAATRHGGLGLGEPMARLGALVGLSVAVFFVGTFVFAPPDTEPDFWGHTLRCVGVTAALAALPLALGVVSFRHGFVGASTWRSAALGVAAGALAAATMSLACTTDGVAHVLVGHGSMMLIGGALGAVFGRATRA